MKAIEQYFHVVLSVYYAIQDGLNFYIYGWNPGVPDYSNESYWAVHTCGTVLKYAAQGGSNF